MTSLLITSALVSLGIGLFWLVRPLLRRRLGSRVVAGLWLVLAIRLLCPWPLTLPWRFPFLSSTMMPAPVVAPEIGGPSIRVSVAGDARKMDFTVSHVHSHAFGFPSFGSSGFRVLRWRGWRGLWLSGVLLGFVRLAWGIRQVRRWSGRTLPGHSAPALQSAFDDLPSHARRGVALLLTDDLPMPTLAGILRPQIWFPRAWLMRLQPDELRHVLLHELGHARRRDLLAQWVCAAACCLHWFNPLVWALARWARADRELACDAWVLERLTTGQKDKEAAFSYGQTLLKVAGGLREMAMPPFSPAVAAMAADRSNVGLRVREIGSFHLLPRWRGRLVLGMAVVGLAASIFAASAPMEEQPPSVSASPTAVPIAPVQILIPASSTNSPTPSPSPETSQSPGLPNPAGLVRPVPSPAGAPLVHRHGIEIEAKFVEFSQEALRAVEKARRSTPTQRFLAQQLSVLGAGKPAAGVASSSAFPLLGVFKEEEFKEFARQMSAIKGVDLLGAPRVTTKSGQKATVEIVREMHYPDAFDHGRDATGKPVVTPSHFDKKNTGVTLEVEPTLSPREDMIDLKLSCQIVDFEGFVRGDGNPHAPGETVTNRSPVFATQKIDTAVTMYPGSTVLLGKAQHPPGSWQSLDVAASSKEENMSAAFFHRQYDKSLGARALAKAEKEERVVLIFVTANLVDFDAPPQSLIPSPARMMAPGIYSLGEPPRPAAPPSSPTPPTPSNGESPYAVPVPGKPGFVISPYAPDAGYIDVTGFKPGDSAHDPYTGKYFLVP